MKKRYIRRRYNRKSAPQCVGINQDGTRCRNRTKNSLSLCHIHRKLKWNTNKCYKRTVIDVIDGDTFKIEGDIIRPTGYDTPEKGDMGYEDAQKDLKSLTSNSVLKICPKTRDKYGRIIADVYKSGRNISDLMKAKGW